MYDIATGIQKNEFHQSKRDSDRNNESVRKQQSHVPLKRLSKEGCKY